MNVTDYSTHSGSYGNDNLETIFIKQSELMKKYKVIEQRNGLLTTDRVPVDIDTHRGQQRIKDFFWRFTEELGEAMEIIEEYRVKGSHIPKAHMFEELADALHFLVEASILANITPQDLINDLSITHDSFSNPYDKLKCLFTNTIKVPADYVDWHLVKISFGGVVITLTQAANCLKNKPWKQSQMLTDIHRFKTFFIRVFRQFIGLTKLCGMDDQMLFDFYMRKNEVNKFRQDSNY